MQAAKPKIAIVGSGKVGSMAALVCARMDLGDITLLDVVEGLPQGTALDIEEAGPLLGFNARVRGSNDFSALKNAEVVVITAGLARKPGMDRLDLLKKNKEIVEGICDRIKVHAPRAIVIVVTNPLDVVAYIAFKRLGFPKQRVMGMAGVLDGTRMATFVAEKTGVPREQVQAMVLGSHGDHMVPLIEHCRVAGKRLRDTLSKEDIDAIVQRTQKAGGEIVSHLKTGSAYIAPGVSIAKMVAAILKDKKEVLPCSAYLEGEYGLENVFAGVPCVLGKNGVEAIKQLDLSEAESEKLRASALETKKALAEIL